MWRRFRRSAGKGRQRKKGRRREGMLDAHNTRSRRGPGRLNAGEVAGKGGVRTYPRGQRREGIAKNKEKQVDPQGRRLTGERSNNTENRWQQAGLRDSVENKEVWSAARGEELGLGLRFEKTAGLYDLEVARKLTGNKVGDWELTSKTGWLTGRW